MVSKLSPLSPLFSYLYESNLLISEFIWSLGIYACNAGDLGLIPGLGRSPGEGKGYPLLYSGLEKSMNCIESMGCKESDTTELRSLLYMIETLCYTCLFVSCFFHFVYFGDFFTSVPEELCPLFHG